MEQEKTRGYVYILTNKSFRDDWVKIGKSSRPVNVRSKELDNTAVPLPFDIYATMQTEKYNEIEKIIHKQIDRLTDLRIRQNREFFNVHPAQALDLLMDLATAFDDAVICKYVDGKPTQVYPVDEAPKPEVKKKEKKEKDAHRKPFTFDMIGLSIGDKVRFDPLDMELPIAGPNKIEYQGRLWTLSAFCGTYLPEKMQNTSGAYQGPKYFSYGGKTLWKIRLETEEKPD